MLLIIKNLQSQSKAGELSALQEVIACVVIVDDAGKLVASAGVDDEAGKGESK